MHGVGLVDYAHVHCEFHHIVNLHEYFGQLYSVYL